MPRRPLVRLKQRALWERLELMNRSQRWLAREAGISPGYLSDLANEGRAPSGPLRQRLQAALGIDDFDELFALEYEDEAS